MSYYLIDFENVRTDGVRSLTDLKCGDTVAIFYSEQCKNITLDVIENLTRQGVQICCYQAKLGTKNALDFQLSSYLGYIIGKGNPGEDYYIVSNDKCTFRINGMPFSHQRCIRIASPVCFIVSGSRLCHCLLDYHKLQIDSGVNGAY